MRRAILSITARHGSLRLLVERRDINTHRPTEDEHEFIIYISLVVGDSQSCLQILTQGIKITIKAHTVEQHCTSYRVYKHGQGCYALIFEATKHLIVLYVRHYICRFAAIPPLVCVFLFQMNYAQWRGLFSDRFCRLHRYTCRWRQVTLFMSESLIN